MSAPPNNIRIARFGVFELDLSAGELRKSGVKLRLQGQPIQVLTVLLERAGDIVTREELQPETLGRRHLCRLRPQPEHRDQQGAGGSGRLRFQPSFRGNSGSPRISLYRSRSGSGSSSGPGSSTMSVSAEVASDAPPRTTEQQPKAPVTLHPELDVPIPRRGLTRGLFALIQVMYLCFYVAALFHLHGVQRISDEACHHGRRLRYWPR